MTACALLTQQPLFERYLRRADYQLSAYSFANIFSWKDFFDFEFKVIDDALCIFARNALGVFLYLPPLGKNVTKETMDQCFDRMFQENKGRGVSRIENIEEPQLSFFPGKEYVIYKKSEDFVYRRDDLAGLKGNKYKSKRSAYNQFARLENHQFISYEPKMKKECLDLYFRWAEERKKVNTDEIYQEMISESYQAHEVYLKYFKELGLIGRVILEDKKILGYTFGVPLKENVFCVLLETTDLTVKGLSTYIFSKFCSDPRVQPFEFINVMDDFGLENIRKAKLSFKPCERHAAYVISRKELAPLENATSFSG